MAYQKDPDFEQKFSACDLKFPEDFKVILQIKEEQNAEKCRELHTPIFLYFEHLRTIFTFFPFGFLKKLCVNISNILNVYNSWVMACNPCVVNV